MKPSALPPGDLPLDRATHLTRRTFLGGVLVTGGAAVWRFLLQPLWGTGPTSPDAFEALVVETVAGFPISSEIGRSYLRIRSTATAEVLLKELKESLSRDPARPANREQLRDQFERLIREDLRSGRVTPIHSGQLAITECRLAGLQYLLNPPLPNSLPGLDERSFRVLAQVSDWGPKSTQSPGGFNLQKDGSSALWFRIAGVVRGPLTVGFAGQPLETRLGSGLVTARLPPKQASQLLAIAAIYPVTFMDNNSNEAQLIGFFHNWPGEPDQPYSPMPMDLQGFEARDFWPIVDWGPHTSAVGSAFNPQSDGRSALWVRGSSAFPPGLFLILGGFPLPTLVRDTVITAAASPILVRRFVSRPGKLLLQLVDPTNRHVQTVGDFEAL